MIKWFYVILLLFPVLFSSLDASSDNKSPQIKKITSILPVDKIEPCLEFWVDRLDFIKTVEVKDGEELGFVILSKGNYEIMLQTDSSISKDLPLLQKDAKEAVAFLYIEVASIEEILTKIKENEIIVPLRTTFYGAKEIYLRTPGGHVVGIAEQTAE